MSPRVTIYLPTCQRPKLLARAISSVLAQTYKSFELLIAIDGPDPETSSTLEQWRDGRIRVLQLAERGGACRARNRAIETANGDLITGLDDDDEFLPNHLETLVRVWDSGAFAFVCTSSQTLQSEGVLVRHAFTGPVALEHLLAENVVGNQVLTRTAYLRELGGFDPEMPAWQDYDLWVRLCAHYGAGFRQDARTYLQHQDHSGPRISNPDRVRAAHHRFVQKHEIYLNPQRLASLALLYHQTAHVPFSVPELLSYVRWGLGKRAALAFLGDHWPALRILLRRFRDKAQGSL